MTCPGCQQENPAQARFCMKCGTRLTLACTKCNTELPSGAAFCIACGQPRGVPWAASDWQAGDQSRDQPFSPSRRPGRRLLGKHG